MPEPYFSAAVAQIAAVLAQFRDARPLTPAELASYGSGFRTGWTVPKLLDGDPSLELRVLVPKAAPFAPTRIAVAPAPPVLEWPHLEAHGLLCLVGDAESVSIASPGSVLVTLLEKARELVSASLAGANTQDFEDEFTSYWERWEHTKETLFILCNPLGPSRTLTAWRANGGAYVAESEAALRSWVNNRFGDDTARKLSCASVPLLWLPRPLRPSEYPTSISAVRAALQEDPLRRRALDEALLPSEPAEKLIVLGMQSRRGIAFAGLQVKKPVGLQNGFRQRPPDEVILTRYNSAASIGVRAVRFDPSWVHGRDKNPDVARLRAKRVIVIGVGSIGSSVADLLVKAGVGVLTCMDPDALTSANSSRHLLGAPAVGQNKAVAVSQSLASRFPHIAITAITEPVEDEEPILAALRAADLIVSMTGSWPAESLLDALWQADTTLPPIMYGWAEPHAAAGHAVVLRRGFGCLHCLLDESGKMRVPVTSWSAGTLLEVPACGEVFQPYGATESTHIHALVAELALDFLLDRVPESAHRAWIARQDIVARAGGVWTPSWIAAHGDPGAGGRLHDVAFESACARCQGA